jgi:hypothetical protein
MKVGAAHLKNWDTPPPNFRGCGVYVCKRRVNFVNARVYCTFDVPVKFVNSAANIC